MSSDKRTDSQRRHDAADRVVEMVDHLISEAARQHASDIHIEPGQKEAIVRYRIDGILHVKRRIPVDQLPQVVSRVKIMATLDVTERRMPLDGRVGFGRKQPQDPYVDLRVSTVPLLAGEKICIRLLYKEKEQSDIDNMGFLPDNLVTYRKMVETPSGLILHAGPAGSGKTTAVYAAIRHLNDPGRNISTVEDPIEYELDGINQAQVMPDQGLTFAAILRAYMRQDCNVILVGELRDGETCEIAIQASLTGHLILGTIHAESSVGCVARLQELGISNYFIGSALRGIVAQRLVRRLCEKCREGTPVPERLMQALDIPMGKPIYKNVGCRACSRSGYKGRIAIHEVLDPDAVVRELIYRGAPPDALEEAATNNGMIPLWLDALLKVKAGETTLEEAARVVRGVMVEAKANDKDGKPIADPLAGIL